MWFEDLSPCTCFPVDAKLVAVGWLDRGKPYPTGAVERLAYDALVEMRKNPWQPLVCMGSHACNLCQFEPGARGAANIFIPSEGVIYVCPEMIVHYMNAHGYAPPEVFCRAVLACPPMRSMEYLKEIAKCGGGSLLKPPSNK
jgi:hypothetical protein